MFPKSSPMNPCGMNVLVADDDPVVLASTARVLGDAGYRVTPVASGEEAWRMVQKDRPDLVLHARDLPGIDGLEVCRRIKSRPELADVFVVIISSARGESDEQAEGLEAGADGYIVRPISDRELLARVEAFIRILRLKRSLREQAAELKKSNEDARRTQIASLNLMEDAVAARDQAERANQALRKSEERLRLALIAAKQGIYDLNVQTGEAVVTPEYAVMLGYDPATFHETNAAWRERLHPDDAATMAHAYEDYVAGHTLEYRAEFRQRMKSGEWKWILSVGRMMEYDQAGRPLRMVGTHTDIDERKRNEERFTTLFQASPVPTAFTIVATGQLLEVNPAICEFFGWERDQVLGKTVYELDAWCEPEKRRALIEKLRQRGSVQAAAVRLQHRSGEGRMVLMSMKLLDVPGINEPTLVVMFTDMSEREAAAQRQATLQRTIRTILEANSLIVRATSEERLLQDFCDQMVRQTNHRLIWIGFVDEQTKAVRITAKAGPAMTYLDGIQISADDSPSGKGPSGTCLRTGQPVSSPSLAEDPNFELWRERANQAGLASSISLPLRVDGRVIGAFTLYSSTPGRFDQEETRLLAALADDLSFAIGVLRRERWLRTISHAVEHSPATVVITDLDGSIQYVNPKFTELTGYTAEEALGKNPRILKSGDVSGETYRELWKTIRSGGEWHGELHNRKKNGEMFWETAWISGVPDEHGAISSFIALKEDITARKEAEGRLWAQVARTELLNRITRAIGERIDVETILLIVTSHLEDHLPVDFAMACLADETQPTLPQLIVTSLGLRSMQMAETTGLREGQPLPIDSQGLARCMSGAVIHEPDFAAADDPVAAALARAGMSCAVSVPLMLKDVVFGVLVVGRKEPRSFSSPDCEFLRQLGEQVALAVHQGRLYADLQKSNKELRETQNAVLQQERLRALGQMASGVAHDINNAISPITIYSDLLLLKEPTLSEESKEFVTIMQRAAYDVAATVARLREFYRQREPQSEVFPVQLNRLVKEVIGLTRARWVDIPQERGIVIDLQTDLALDLPDVDGIESELREALINLIFNAADAMTTGGRLTIRTGLRGSGEATRIFVEVADTGHGMDEETRLRCLEPFFTTKGERGTGLGLAMVCGVAQRHEATLEIESELGRGTTMRMVFPLPSGTAARAVEDGTPPPPPRMRILLVDDDPLIIKALRIALVTDGHLVESAEGGQQGLDLFREALDRGAAFDVVITDLGMPVIDGRAVAAGVKTAAPGTHVIMLTGWGQRLLDEGAIPPHVDEMLSKPPDLASMRAALLKFAPARRE